ncbi:Zinc finger, RING-type [Corchorus olitorius]|uniref:Zinc finger, RING-type n=1 Tax=Corchorus olitorius TaxID=93759 RepID=A0A1R3K462_9ROSI|nr:Zinc finger, RING-type [Corchorus olitorius]
MCSVTGMNQLLKLHLDNSQSMMTLSTESDLVDWCFALDLFARLVAYVAVLEKARVLTDGTCEEEGEDIETGSCSSSEELYDGRMCVICYDEQRNCFLVPCGHCATCYDCAQRIYEGENKVCPVCRRVIGKVRRLFAP